MVKNKNVPEIRFSGFRDDWEVRKLRDSAFFIDGNYGAKYPKDSEFIDEGIPFFTSSVIGVNGIFDKKHVKYISEKKNTELKKAQSRGGDLILTNRGASMGSAAQIPETYTDVNIGPQLTRIRCNQKTDNLFLLSILKNSTYKNKLLSMNAGSAMNFVGLETLGTFKYSEPCFEEQIKIGRFFKQLDDTIALHQHKLNILKQTKQGFLQKMFPKEGESVPELRFPGFTDDWELRKLGDESNILAGGDVNKNKLKKFGKYPVLANALTKDGVMGYYDEDYRVEAPAVTVTGRGDVGHAKARKTNFTPVVRLLSVKSNHDVDFLENSINNHCIFVESTGVPQLTSPQLGNYQIFFPTLEEQKKIGSFFKTLDNTFALHQRELDLLKETKKGFLQKLFV